MENELLFSSTACGVSRQASLYLSQTYEEEKGYQTDGKSHRDSETLGAKSNWRTSQPS